MTGPAPGVVVTCEHGGNHIPALYRALFGDLQAALASHRGFDPGALEMAEDLARAFGAQAGRGHTESFFTHQPAAPLDTGRRSATSPTQRPG